MMKKIAALAGAGAILLSVAVPVLALPFSYDWADVNNSAVAVSDTGRNSQGNGATAVGTYNSAVAGSGSGNRWMSTGGAFSYAEASVKANTHIGCGFCYPYDGYYYGWHEDFAYVDNGAVAGASTGGNSQGNSALASGSGNSANAGSGSGDRGMTTGLAMSDASAWVIVNTHWGD